MGVCSASPCCRATGLGTYAQQKTFTLDDLKPYVENLVWQASGTERLHVSIVSMDVSASDSIKIDDTGWQCEKLKISVRLEAKGCHKALLALFLPAKSSSEELSGEQSELLKGVFEMPGPLTVMIKSATDLRNADHLPGMGKSDPYVKCYIAKKPPESGFQTKVIDNNLNPEWNHEGQIAEYTAGDNLCFACFDSDVGKADDDLGEALLLEHEFFPQGYESTVRLACQKRKDQTSALHIKVTLGVLVMSLPLDLEVQLARISGKPTMKITITSMATPLGNKSWPSGFWDCRAKTATQDAVAGSMIAAIEAIDKETINQSAEYGICKTVLEKVLDRQS